MDTGAIMDTENLETKTDVDGDEDEDENCGLSSKIPWMVVVRLIAEDPEPLHTLKIRCRALLNLALVNRHIFRDVYEYGLSLFAEKHISETVNRSMFELVSLDMALATDDQVKQVYRQVFPRTDARNMNALGATSIRIAVQSAQSTMFNAPVVELVKMQVAVEDMRIITKDLAKELFALTKDDLNLATIRMRHTVKTYVDAKEVALYKHGNSTNLTRALESAKELSALRRARSRELWNRQSELNLQCKFALYNGCYEVARAIGFGQKISSDRGSSSDITPSSFLSAAASTTSFPTSSYSSTSTSTSTSFIDENAGQQLRKMGDIVAHELSQDKDWKRALYGYVYRNSLRKKTELMRMIESRIEGMRTRARDVFHHFPKVCASHSKDRLDLKTVAMKYIVCNYSTPPPRSSTK